ncbi:MAG: YHS domain-containing protein [Nitrososphaerales archaeon]
MARDPVCGMEVDEKHTSFKSLYKNVAYYFCCKPCKDTFDKSPDRYIKN